MIVAIPTQAGKIAPQCDGVSEFTLVEGIGVLYSTTVIPVAYDAETDELARVLSAQGVSRILVSNITRNLEQALSDEGITVFKGAAGTIKDAVNVISSGGLDTLLQAYGQSCGGGCASGSCSCGGRH